MRGNNPGKNCNEEPLECLASLELIAPENITSLQKKANSKSKE
jgi:hypothetical protein